MKPKFDAGMYFAYGKRGRADLQARTTFEAIKSGERTSTTRFPEDSQSQFDAWAALKAGDVVRVWSGKWDRTQGAFTGESLLIEITHAPAVIDLRRISPEGAKRWEATEGWSETELEHYRSIGRTTAVYVRYRFIDS